MALTPKELLKKDPLDQDILDALEAEIDGKLREAAIQPGAMLSFSYAEAIKPADVSKATIKAFKMLYEAAGWRDVRINRVHGILTMTCPRFRSRHRDDDPETGEGQ